MVTRRRGLAAPPGRKNGPPQHDLIAVEIGSYEGRTTIALALGMRARGAPGTVVAIDPHTSAERSEAFLRNLAGAGVRDEVRYVRMRSHEARPLIAGRSVDVLWIDGSHSYEDVLQDIDDWTSALAPGAMVGFNDPWLGGVNRALFDRLGRRGTPYRNARWAVNSLFFDHRPDAPWTLRDRIRTARLRAFLRAGMPLVRLTRRRGGRAPDRGDRRFDQRLARRVLRTLLPIAEGAHSFDRLRRLTPRAD